MKNIEYLYALEILIKTKEKIIQMSQQSITKEMREELNALNKVVQKALLKIMNNMEKL